MRLEETLPVSYHEHSKLNMPRGMIRLCYRLNLKQRRTSLLLVTIFTKDIPLSLEPASMPKSHYTARLTNLSPTTTLDSLTSSSLFTSHGLSVSPGQTRISLATGLEGTKIATVTFRDEWMLHQALSLGPRERMVDGRCVALDAGFEGFTPLSDGEDIE
jgi:hypothetical protein